MIHDVEYMQERRISVWSQVSLKKVSWVAVFAGFVVTACCQLLLSLLGMGIGLTTIDPISEQNPLSGIGAGTAIWWSASMLISLFVGGWSAAKLAGIPKKSEGFLHGFLTWGILTLASAFFVTSAAGVALGGIGGIISGALGKNVNVANMGQANQAARNATQTAQAVVGQINSPQARQTGDVAARNLSMAAFVAFFALLLGAGIAGLGGIVGAPKYLAIGPVPEAPRKY